MAGRNLEVDLPLRIEANQGLGIQVERAPLAARVRAPG